MLAPCCRCAVLAAQPRPRCPRNVLARVRCWWPGLRLSAAVGAGVRLRRSVNLGAMASPLARCCCFAVTIFEGKFLRMKLINKVLKWKF